MQNTSFLSVTINDCMLASEPGSAQLPFYSTHILIPKGCVIEDITVSTSEPCDYSDFIQTKQLLPAQQETPFSSHSTMRSMQMNQSWYQQHSFQPSELITSHDRSYMKGYPMKTIHVYPLRYNPGDHQLYFYDQLMVTVTFSSKPSVIGKETGVSNRFLREKHADADAVKDLVLNPEHVDSYSDGEDEVIGGMRMMGYDESSTPLSDNYPGGLCTASETIEYVIVTSQDLSENSAYEYSWPDLCTHRHQIDGLTSEIVTIEEIVNCQDYFNETEIFNDSAARLREFCKDAYLDWNTEYILLGGTWEKDNSDRQIVPCRMLEDREQTLSTKSMPSDLYFSNLDGDWYYDSIGMWGGGRSGANDKLSELSVGRIPLWNAEMVSNAVEKIIWYDTCNDESFLRSAGFLGGDLGWDVTSKQYMEEIRKGDGSWSQYTGFEEWNTNYPSYPIDTSERYYDADYPSEFDAVQAWTEAINNNQLCLISHLDHGSSANTLSLGDGSSLSNSHYFIGTSQACLSGRYTDGSSGASTFLSSCDDKGAFAMILNTGYGYGSSSSTFGKSQLQHKIFWNYFFENQTTDFDNWQLGNAMRYTKDLFSSNIDIDHIYTYVWYSWNLFGDPAQQLRLNERVNLPPQIDSINIPDDARNVSMNLSSLSVNISDEDSGSFSWSIETSPDIGSNSSQQGSSGQQHCLISNLSCLTSYTWYVNVSDESFQVHEIYTFTTGPDPLNDQPIVSNPLPQNHSINVDVWTNQVSVQLNDSNNDTCAYTIEGRYVENTSNNTLANTTIHANCSFPLPFNTEIRWLVTVDDHRSYPVTSSFNFTTRGPFTPTLPQNVSLQSLNRTAILLNWTKNTSSDHTVIERNTISSWNLGEGTMVYNGTKNVTIDPSLLPGITYNYQIWGYNATDHLYSQNFLDAQATTLINHPVTCSNPNPLNNSINHSLNLTWQINLSDIDGDRFNWTITCNDTRNNCSISDTNGTKSLLLTNLSYYTEYTIWVNATDGYNTTNETFSFRTKLPNDTQKPQIHSIMVRSTHTTADSSEGWDQLRCNITDNFRLNNITLNITTEQNTSQNLSLSQSSPEHIWTINHDIPITNTMNLTLYVTDLNGNLNHSNIPLISITPTIGSSDQNVDYSAVPLDFSTISFTVNQSANQTLNYTLRSSPDIGEKNGNITSNKTIISAFSTLSYDTEYECTLTLYNHSNPMVSNPFISYETVILFTSESAPEQPSQDYSPPSNPGSTLPPMPPVEPEEEVNLPPERPLPPQGSIILYEGEQLIIRVSSWDKDEDRLRLQVQWNDGSISEWSTLVTSNETIQFNHTFTTVDTFTVRVRAQDEHNMNSTWSKPLSVTILERENEVDNEPSEFEIDINNETKETSFRYNNQSQSPSNQQVIQWDFGDGTILEGSTPKHTYQEPGEYTVTVTITDETGNVTMKTFTVTIPEPQQQVETNPLSTTEKIEPNRIPWIIVLIGIIISLVAVVLLIHFRVK